MINSNDINVQGRFIVETTNPNSGLVTARYESSNTVTRSGKNLILKMLLDIPGYDIGLTYQAIGSGTTAVSIANIALDTETIRRPCSLRQDTTGTVAAFTTYFTGSDLSDASVTGSEEVGIFGYDASNTADSGTLFSRALLSSTFTAGEDVTISYVLTVS